MSRYAAINTYRKRTKYFQPFTSTGTEFCLSSLYKCKSKKTLLFSSGLHFTGPSVAIPKQLVLSSFQGHKQNYLKSMKYSKQTTSRLTCASVCMWYYWHTFSKHLISKSFLKARSLHCKGTFLHLHTDFRISNVAIFAAQPPKRIISE